MAIQYEVVEVADASGCEHATDLLNDGWEIDQSWETGIGVFLKMSKDVPEE